MVVRTRTKGGCHRRSVTARRTSGMSLYATEPCQLQQSNSVAIEPLKQRRQVMTCGPHSPRMGKCSKVKRSLLCKQKPAPKLAISVTHPPKFASDCRMVSINGQQLTAVTWGIVQHHVLLHAADPAADQAATLLSLFLLQWLVE